MMKKHKLIGFAAVAAFFLLLSCKNNLSPEIPVEDIIISPHNEGKISIVSGMSKNITVKIIPENATNKTLAYSSTPGGVAAIDSSGSIRAGKVGNAVIKITAANGVKREIKVTVVQDQNSVASIEFEEQPADPVELVIGESYELKLKVMPETAANKTLNITSSNDSVAWPNGYGNRWIKAKKEGQAIITIKSVSNPSVKKEVRFKIKPLPSIELIKEEITSENSESNLNLEIKTLHGKLSYTPKIVGEESGWLTVVRVDNTTDVGKDTIYLKAAQNKTVWKRTAYINFKDGSNQEIKNADGEKLEVKVVQEENKNPTVRIKWVHGIGEPSQVEKERGKIETPIPGQAKKFYWDDDKIFFWYENEKTKWFNNRKLYPLKLTDSVYSDSAQCWGKTASNMLHWWFVQNKENIDNYITKKNITGAEKNKYQDFYNRNSPDNEEPEKSYIAKTFRTKAHNGANGDYIEHGLVWYLCGRDNISRQKDYKGPALFKDVFEETIKDSEKSPIKTTVIQQDIDLFNTTLWDALSHKKAIGVVIGGTKDNRDYKHAITLWGAVFDDRNEVVAIYVVDNNFGENRIFPYGIWHKDGRPYLFNYGGANDFVQNRYVSEVVTLDPGEAQWKEWFDNNP
ncbi:IdeS/Mac family cysteine endopeptidase [Treponema denticola]|uniref:IdeS/Mac family cysteine endopeptidase n=1 Tax=Treponema denticola TaxID=158 RepID=UPI0020A2EEFA|nr:IdeS/Mac family cysteine endopeptidase [Treponema denticola]UTC83695.1 hypothetical protein HGJ18_10950 [Treponema denticola]